MIRGNTGQDGIVREWDVAGQRYAGSDAGGTVVLVAICCTLGINLRRMSMTIDAQGCRQSHPPPIVI